MFPPRYDDAPPQKYEYSQPHMSTDGTRPSAPQFQNICIRYLPVHKHRVLLYYIIIYKIHDSYDITIDDVL